MLYKGVINQDVEKEKNLTVYQLKKARFEIDKGTNGIEELLKQNEDLKKKINRYIRLIKEQKVAIEKAIEEANIPEDLNELSVTRKLGHTEIGDISDTFDLGSAVNKSQEDNIVSRANINAIQDAISAIKHKDFAQDSIEVLNRDDISERSFVPQHEGQLNLSMNLGA